MSPQTFAMQQYTPYVEVMQLLRTQIASHSHLDSHPHSALFSFNVDPEELGAAHALLDKQPQRRAMKVTYNDDYNFIVKYMPGGAHEIAYGCFTNILNKAAAQLTGQLLLSYGYRILGSKTYELIEGGRKQADTCIVPNGILSPSIVIEVGSSESLTQLRGDAKRWLESDFYDVKMVIVISIDPPIPPNQTPQITVEHWKSMPPRQPPHTPVARTKVAYKVWAADWTLAVSANYYILLADIFGSTPIPPIFGANTRLTFDNADVVAWRSAIISEWQDDSV